MANAIVSEVGSVLCKQHISPSDISGMEDRIRRIVVSESTGKMKKLNLAARLCMLKRFGCTALLRNDDLRKRKVHAEIAQKGGLYATLTERTEKKGYPSELVKTLSPTKRGGRKQKSELEKTIQRRNQHLAKEQAKNVTVFSSLGMEGPATPDSTGFRR